MFYIVAFPSLFMDAVMPWNPQIYDQFKAERQQPFFDLMAHIQAKPNLSRRGAVPWTPAPTP